MPGDPSLDRAFICVANTNSVMFMLPGEGGRQQSGIRIRLGGQ